MLNDRLYQRLKCIDHCILQNSSHFIELQSWIDFLIFIFFGIPIQSWDNNTCLRSFHFIPVVPMKSHLNGPGNVILTKCPLHRILSYHCGDVIMGTIASQITSLTIVYSTVYSDADRRKHQSSASLAFVWGIHRGPVNSPHKWPVTRKMFPFDDDIMLPISFRQSSMWHWYHYQKLTNYLIYDKLVFRFKQSNHG